MNANCSWVMGVKIVGNTDIWYQVELAYDSIHYRHCFPYQYHSLAEAKQCIKRWRKILNSAAAIDLTHEWMEIQP